jgi:hypothetical protein
LRSAAVLMPMTAATAAPAIAKMERPSMTLPLDWALEP